MAAGLRRPEPPQLCFTGVARERPDGRGVYTTHRQVRPRGVKSRDSAGVDAKRTQKHNANNTKRIETNRAGLGAVQAVS